MFTSMESSLSSLARPRAIWNSSPATTGVVLLTVLASMLCGCGRGGATPSATQQAPTAASAAPALLLSPEDLVTIAARAATSGPAITGSVQPERHADLRAEVSAIVLQVLKDNGDSVRRGDLLVRLDDTAIRESLSSAEASATAAAQAYEQAERQLQRLSQLRKSGVVSVQALEDVEIRRNNAQSDLEAAKSRAALARQQLQRTTVHAPFDGIVSDRRVSAGDTAQIGKELLKVIDPTSVRFEGMVSANDIGAVRTDQRVVFQVHGYGDKEFSGKIARVNPAANAITRQVEVLVEFAAAEQPTVAGLYAEGRIETSSRAGLAVPASAVLKEGDTAIAWRVKDGALHRTALSVQGRDARSGAVFVGQGLSAGDQVLRYPTATLKDGSRVELAGPALIGAR